MSIHKKILEAQNRLDDMQDDFEHGLVGRDMVSQARHELNDLRWVRDNLTPAPRAVIWQTEYEMILDTVTA